VLKETEDMDACEMGKMDVNTGQKQTQYTQIKLK
jgi:hypothetical protein